MSPLVKCTVSKVQVFMLLLAATLLPVAAQTTRPAYSHGTPSRDGTGKLYMGREIAQVMGHRGASWLERPERKSEEKPDLLIAALASSHPETHYLSFLKGCFLYQIQRFMGDSIGRQQGSGGRVLQMQFSTNTSPSKPPSIMASSDSFTTVAGPTPTD